MPKRCVVATLWVAGAGLTLAATAQADRIGQGPVRDPTASTEQYVSFRLLGTNWGQARGQTEATPEVGAYGQTGSTGCRMTANVSAIVMASRPKVTPTHVDVAGLFPPVRIADHGVNKHGIRWWAGSQVSVRAAAVGYQKASASVSRPGRPWLVYKIVLRGISKNPSCTPSQALATARGITRSMHLNAGKLTPESPYYD
jgi:hypothetical protein